MQNTIAFDTLAYAKKMKSAGFTEQQAEVQAEAFMEIVEGKLASKQDIFDLKRDIKELEVALKKDIQELETGFKRDIKKLETGLKRDMKELEINLKYDLTLRLGGMMVAGIAVVAALVKLL